MNRIMHILRKMTLVVCSVFLALGVGMKSVSAEDAMISFEKRPGSEASSDLFVISGDTKTPATVYCMQQEMIHPAANVYPGNPVPKYTIADSYQNLTKERIDIITKILYVGYPYNSLGYFDHIYETYKDYGTLSVDYLVSGFTQDIIWYFMKEWGIPGNDEHIATIESVLSDPENADEDLGKPILNILKYIEESGPLSPPDASTFKIEGTGVLEKENDVYKTEVKIKDPDGYRAEYELTCKDVKAIDSSGNEITTVNGGETFYLVASDIKSLSEDSGVTVSAVLEYPGTATIYVTETVGKKRMTDGTSKTAKFQDMIGISINTLELSDTLKVTAVEPVETELKIEKSFSEASYTPTERESYDFTVNVYAGPSDGVTYPRTITLTYGVNGFGSTNNKITFAKEGTYELDVVEVDPGTNDKMFYDGSIWSAKFDIKNKDNKLAIDSATYYRDGDEVGSDIFVFVNTVVQDEPDDNVPGKDTPDKEDTKKPDNKPYIVPNTSVK